MALSEPVRRVLQRHLEEELGVDNAAEVIEAVERVATSDDLNRLSDRVDRLSARMAAEHKQMRTESSESEQRMTATFRRDLLTQSGVLIGLVAILVAVLVPALG